jgi:hypothetical protein
MVRPKANRDAQLHSVRSVEIVSASDAIQAGVPPERVHQVPIDQVELGVLAQTLVEDVWVTVDLDSDWVAAYRICGQARHAVVGELRIYPKEGNMRDAGQWSARYLGARAPVPGGGLRATTVRAARLGSDVLGGRLIVDQDQRRAHAKKARSSLVDHLAQLGIIRPSAPPAPARRSVPRSHVRLARIAKTYADAIASGSRRAIADVAVELGLKPSHVRYAINRARASGLLTETQQGKPGGQLTHHGQSILANSGH